MAKIKKDEKNLKGPVENEESNITDKEKEFSHETKETMPLSQTSREGLLKTKEFLEKEELLTKEQMQGLRKRIETADLSDELKKEAEIHARELKFLEEEEKIKQLLKIIEEKKGKDGVVYAVKVAQKMDDPYILDKLHDTLVKEGYYKSFLKKT